MSATQDSDAKVEKVYGLIGSRLVETKQAFVIIKSLSEAFGGDVSKELHERINELSPVVWPVIWSCQVATFTGLISVLDTTDGDATVPNLARLIRARGGEVPEVHLEKLASIREKYNRFRNKLFAHNSLQRESFGKKFNEAGISWSELSNEFEEVERIFWQVCDKDELLSLSFSPVLMTRDVQATEATIQDLIAKFKG